MPFTTRHEMWIYEFGFGERITYLDYKICTSPLFQKSNNFIIIVQTDSYPVWLWEPLKTVSHNLGHVSLK